MLTDQAFLIINLTIVTFISSNIDNLMLMIGFMSYYDSYKKEVFLGYLINIFSVSVAALIFSYFTELFPIHYLKYLGIIPISLGFYQVLHIFNPSLSYKSVAQLNLADSRFKIILAVCGVMLANSGDTLAVFLAFMSDTQKSLRWLVIVTALLMTCLWGLIAKLLLSDARLVSITKVVAQYVLPFILIFIGWYILTDSPTDSETFLKKINPST